ncbi:putative bifunctional diguanylate cyclase/phosphodiesterase [Parasphingorhabdus litoris]|uniref:putative bifunctional diguanylate cyclase/phosphodiesterase n=1 Tax=Parasphingorhabdus litoris TaxID=394733 RepID=UPI001E2E65EC|nr:EAL domain-containing protein [Parasphingorhabdus litoris]
MTSTIPKSTAFIDAAAEQAYRPIVKAYLGAAALYYAIMTFVHFWTINGSNLVTMATASITACGVSIFAWRALSRPLELVKRELLVGLVNLLVLANVMAAMHIEHAQENLLYFIMMVMGFAFVSVSMRQAFLSIVVVLGCLFLELVQHYPEQLVVYSFITVGAAFSTATLSYSLRRSIRAGAMARNEAEIKLEEAQNLGQKMRHLSLSDSLTGLPNRRAFFEAFNQYKKGTGSDNGSWLALLDLDGFKAVNDMYGHIMGDELLKAVAKRLQGYCGEEAHVSRTGGDEFSILLLRDGSSEDIELWLQKLLDVIGEIYEIDERLIPVSGSIGCNRIVDDTMETQTIRNADFALLHAKKHGKNRVVVFHDEHAKEAAERFQVEQALRAADFDTEINLVFQPQFDLGKNKIVRAETLARWESPVLGKIGPDQFIKIAEESGLIARITLTVVGKALRVLKSWEDPIPLSINLSSHDLISDQVIDQIVRLVSESGLNPSLIEFEVTETAMMVDLEKASTNLLQLSDIGHPVALDDFGTGYCNFNYLRSLPISKLKVDRSFMENVGDPMTEKILHSLAGIAKTLDVHCLLEGVENELELIIAKRVGPQSVQGYLFGEPMNATELYLHVEAQNIMENKGDRMSQVVGG